MGKFFTSSSARRLGSHEQGVVQKPLVNQDGVQPPPAPAHSRGSNKAQVLSAFRSLVEGRSSAEHARQHKSEASTGAGGPQHHGDDDPPAAANPNPNPNPSQHEHSTAPAPAHSVLRLAKTAPTSAQISPKQLLPRAIKALEKLQQQLSSRTLTYLYQFDGLLSSADASLAAAVALLSSTGSAGTDDGQTSLLQLYNQDAGTTDADAASKVAAVLDLVLQLCMLTWEVEVLMLQHHHAAEPENTTQQAGQFHAHARCLWEAWEVRSLANTDHRAAAPAGTNAEDGCSAAAAAGGAAPEDAWPLTEALCAALAVMAEAATAWSSVQQTSQGDWCYQQLRKHVRSVAAAGGNDSLHLGTRCALQRLQFRILTGSLSLAARQGHQAMWANLTSMVQQLLQHNVMEDGEVLRASLTLVGVLADTASSMMQANSPSASAAPSTSNKSREGCSAATAVAALEFSMQLLDHTKQRAAALEPQQQQQQHQQVGIEEANEASLTQQVADIQQQVLLQLAQAHLACRQPARVLAAVSQLQGLCTGRTPPPGLLQVSSLALLQQGKLGPASAQLCAWLQQGGQSTQEACAAVRTFLVALHMLDTAPAACTTAGAARAAAGSTHAAVPVRCTAGECAAAVQQVAAAAAEHCRSEPAVALEVVLQILAEQGTSSAQLSLEKLAVQLLAIEEVSALLHERPECRQKCHALLHHKGAAHYAAHRYAQAIDLLTPAVFFGTSLTAGKSARLLAMALLRSGQPGRALEYVVVAEQQEGCATATGCIIRLQAALQMQAQATGGSSAAREAAEAASAEVAVVAAAKGLASVADLSSEAMQAAFSLCMQYNSPAAAWQVLLVWRDSAAAPAPSAAAKQAESRSAASTQQQQRLLQVLSLMQLLAADTTCGPTTAGARDTNTTKCAASPVLQERQWLCDMCQTLCSCLPHSQSSTHFSAQQLMWLVETGLQLGVAAAAAAAQQGTHDDDAHAVLQSTLAACSLLRALLHQQPPEVPPQEPQTKEPAAAPPTVGATASTAHQQQATRPSDLSYTGVAAALEARTTATLCVAASLLLQGKADRDASAGMAAARQAGDLLAAAQQQLQQHASRLMLQQQQDVLEAEAPIASLFSSAWADAAAVTDAMQPLQLLVVRQSLALAARQGQEQQVKQLLQLLVQHPLAGPQDLKAAAWECLQPGRSAKGQAVAALAYSHMLRLAAAATPADLPAVAEAATGMLTLVTSHAVKLKAVSKVVEVLHSGGHTAAAADAAAKQKRRSAMTAVAAPIAGDAGTRPVRAAYPDSAGRGFPAKSLQWLLATCWNSAVETSSSGDGHTARQYLQLVAALANSQEQQQQQQQPHWLVDSKQFKHLWARLCVQHGSQQPSQHSLQAPGITQPLPAEACIAKGPAAPDAAAQSPIAAAAAADNHTSPEQKQQQQHQQVELCLGHRQPAAVEAADGCADKTSNPQLQQEQRQDQEASAATPAQHSSQLCHADDDHHLPQQRSCEAEMQQQPGQQLQQEEESCGPAAPEDGPACLAEHPQQQLQSQQQVQVGTAEASAADGPGAVTCSVAVASPVEEPLEQQQEPLPQQQQQQQEEEQPRAGEAPPASAPSQLLPPRQCELPGPTASPNRCRDAADAVPPPSGSLAPAVLVPDRSGADPTTGSTAETEAAAARQNVTGSVVGAEADEQMADAVTAAALTTAGGGEPAAQGLAAETAEAAPAADADDANAASVPSELLSDPQQQPPQPSGSLDKQAGTQQQHSSSTPSCQHIHKDKQGSDHDQQAAVAQQQSQVSDPPIETAQVPLEEEDPLGPVATQVDFCCMVVPTGDDVLDPSCPVSVSPGSGDAAILVEGSGAILSGQQQQQLMTQDRDGEEGEGGGPQLKLDLSCDG